MAAKDFIVAIEIGSSKVTAIAGRKNIDGSISVLAVVKEPSSSFIKRGVIYNIDKTVLCIKNLINKLQQQLKAKIKWVHVGVGGQSIHSVKNIIVKDLAPGTKITQNMVSEIMEENRGAQYSDMEIIDVAEQEYKIDNNFQIDPVGIQCSRLEGHFLNILQRKSFYDKLNKCIENAEVEIADLFLAPLALADSVLTESEKRSGCALADIGADTTTVLVYSKNILRHLAVIPLGSNNITKDIASLQIDESDAEKLKIKYGSAYTDPAGMDSKLLLSLGTDVQVESEKFIEIVEGRTEEIIANVWNQIPQDYANKLIGGIILTGGGSNMTNIVKAFAAYTHIEKIRIAHFVTQTISSSNNDINSHNGMMNTILALLAKGDENCAGGEIDPDDIFSNGTTKTGEGRSGRTKEPRNISELPGGVVPTASDKAKAEEEAQRKQKEAEEEARRKQEEEEERKKKEKKENSFIGRIRKKFSEIAGSLTEPE